MAQQDANDLEKEHMQQLEYKETLGSQGAAEDKTVTFTAAEERSLTKKFDLNVVPLVSVLYLLSYLDRSNIGNAKTAGMQTALKLSSADYTWLLTMFYISYIVFEPAGLGWKIFRPRYWVSAIVMAWGILAMCQAATTSWAGLMVCRFLMGAVEACYGPGVPLYLR